MEYKIETTSPRTKKVLEKYLPIIMRHLGIYNADKALLIKVTGDDLPSGYEGGALYLDIADCYVVMLNKPTRATLRTMQSMIETLCHEMIHIKQLIRGTLKRTPNGAMWRGRLYGNKTAYLDMPWELDAFSKQEILIRKVLA